MKYDFNEMEEQMDLLTKNMDSITEFSGKISSTLQGTRHQIIRLSSVHSLLKKLQFLFKLPNNLKDKINDENYSEVCYSLLFYSTAESRNFPSQPCLNLILVQVISNSWSPHLVFLRDKLERVQHKFLRYLAWKSGFPMAYLDHTSVRKMEKFNIIIMSLLHQYNESFLTY